MPLDASRLATLRSARDAAGAHEACGLLLTDGSVVQTENHAADPGRSFVIDPEILLREAVSGRLLGCWHTHPSGDSRPSDHDLATMATWPDLLHVIVGREVTVWRWRGRAEEVQRHAAGGLGLVSSGRPCTPVSSSRSKASRAAESPRSKHASPST